MIKVVTKSCHNYCTQWTKNILGTKLSYCPIYKHLWFKNWTW